MSITAEAWRGFRDLGRAMTALGTAERHEEMAAFGADLTGNATDLWATYRTAMRRNAVPSADGPASPACLPYVFGVRGNGTCGELPTAAPHGVPITVLAPSERDSESWRTYSEAFYSGAMLRDEVAEILAWHKVNPTKSGSSLKGGALTGSGGSLLNGDQLMTFTGHGWGYGLLQHDFVEDFLLLFYTTSAHAYSRGQWVAPESTNVDRAQPSVTFATPSGLSQPIFLRWMLLFDHPITDTLWVGKAIPHEWLEPGERIAVADAPSRFGNLSFSFVASNASVRVDLSFGARLRGAWPAGGVKVRVRSRLAWPAEGGVTVGGKPWPRRLVNATEQTVHFAEPPLADAAHDIVVSVLPHQQ